MEFPPDLDILEIKCRLYLDDDEHKKAEMFEEDLWEFLHVDIIDLELTDDGIEFKTFEQWTASRVRDLITEWFILINEYKMYWFPFSHPVFKGRIHFNPFSWVRNGLLKRHEVGENGVWYWCLSEDQEEVLDLVNAKIEEESSRRFEADLKSTLKRLNKDMNV